MPARARIVLCILSLVFFVPLKAATYYWVGGTGNWNDLNHWSNGSGGGYTVIPGAQDDVIFDANSFSSATDTVFLPLNVYVKDLDYRSIDTALFYPSSGNSSISVYGDINFNEQINLSDRIYLHLFATTSFTNGIHLQHSTIPYMNLYGKGNWLIEDTATIDYLNIEEGRLRLSSDSLVMVKLAHINSSVSPNLTIELSMQELYIQHISLYQDSLIAPNTRLMGLQVLSSLSTGNFGDIKAIILKEGLANFSVFTANTHIGKLVSNGARINVSGNNTLFLDTLDAEGSRLITFAGSSSNIRHIIGHGTCNRLLSILTSTNISSCSFPLLQSHDLAYCSFQNIQFNNTQTVAYSVDAGGNSGIQFVNERTAARYYWIGGRGGYFDSSHWSLSPGGVPAYCVPSLCDTIVFDANSFPSSDTLFLTEPVEVGGVICQTSNLLCIKPVVNENIIIYGNLFIHLNTAAFNQVQLNFNMKSDAQILTSGSYLERVVILSYGFEMRFPDNNLELGYLNFDGTLDLSGKTLSIRQLNFYNKAGSTLNFDGAVFTISKSVYAYFNISSAQVYLNNSVFYLEDEGRFLATNTIEIPSIIFKNQKQKEGLVHFEKVHPRYLELDGSCLLQTLDIDVDTLLVLADSRIRVNTRQAQLNIKKRFEMIGSCTKPIFFYNISGSNIPAEINLQNSATFNLRYIHFRYVKMTGKSGIVAMSSSQIFNCSGFTVATFPGRKFYWIGGEGYWRDPANWSYTSGGTPVNCIPAYADTVILDGNSFSSDGQKILIDSAYPAVCGFIDASQLMRPATLLDEWSWKNGAYNYYTGISVANGAVFHPNLSIISVLFFYGKGLQQIDVNHMKGNKTSFEIFGGGNYTIRNAEHYAGDIGLNYGLLQFPDEQYLFRLLEIGANQVSPYYPFARAYFQNSRIETDYFNMAGNGFIEADSSKMLFHGYLKNQSSHVQRFKFLEVTGEGNYMGSPIAVELAMQVQTPKLTINGDALIHSSVEADSMLVRNANAITVYPGDTIFIKDYFQMGGQACLRPKFFGFDQTPGYIHSDGAKFAVDFLFIENVIALGNALFEAGSSSVLQAQTGNWTVNPNHSFYYRVAQNDYTICEDSILLDLSNYYGSALSIEWADGRNSSMEWFQTAATVPLKVNYGDNCSVWDTAYVTSYQHIGEFLSKDTFLCGSNALLLQADSMGLLDWTPTWSDGSLNYSTRASSSAVYYLSLEKDGCIKTDSQAVYIAQSAPNALTLSDTLFCIGDSAFIQVPQSPNLHYSWTDGYNGVNRYVAQEGDYYLQNSDSSCLYTDTLQVKLIRLQVTITGDTAFCFGDSTQLSALPVSGTLDWSHGASGANVYASSPGKVMLTRQDSGCRVSDSVLLYEKPLPQIQFSGDSSLCENDSTLITASGNGNSWLWMDGFTDSIRWIAQAGTYSIQAEKDGCYATGSTETYLLDLPDLSWMDYQLCANDVLYLSVPVYPDVIFYLNQNPVSDSFAIQGENDWHLRWEKGKCSKADTFSSFFDYSLPFILPDTLAYCELEDARVNLDIPAPYTMIWNGVEMDDQGVSVYDQTGTFFYSIFDSLNCEIQGQTVVEACGCELYFPNVFTPNSDDKNPGFRGEGCTGLLRHYSLIIFDRWGTILYSTDDPYTYWNGTYEGKACADGVYAFQVTYLSELEDGTYQRFSKTGTITILR